MNCLLVTDFIATLTHDFFVTKIANCCNAEVLQPF